MMSIKNYRNWLVWKEKHQPVSALTGRSAGWNKNLSTFAEAEQFCLDNAGYKIGLCFSEDLPYIGLDLDACIDDDGRIEDWARDAVLTLVDSMVIDNKSVSGTGMKVVLRCSKAVKRGVKFVEARQHGDHAPQIELFSDNKYFALTSPLLISDCSEANEVDLATLSEVMGYDVTEVIQPSESTKKGGDTSPADLQGYLQKIDVTEFDSRESWIKMLQAAHHATGGSEEGREVFEEWSKGDEASFSEADLRRDWDSMKSNPRNPVTIGTIIHHIPKEKRDAIKPEADFEVLPKQTNSQLLGWLLNETCRTHANVVEQMTADGLCETLRFVEEWKCWIYYSQGIWHRDVSGVVQHSIVLAYIKSLAPRIPSGGDDEQAAKARGWIASLLNFNQTNGVIKQAKGSVEWLIKVADFPANTHLLNFTNGTYDLESDKFKGHSPNDFCFSQCSTNYVEGAKSETWEKVIDDIFSGDRELISYVRRVLGCALGGDTSDPHFNIFYGDGCNGKSTIVQCIADLLGDYSKHLPSDLFDAKKELHPTYLASLHGARLAVISEMEADVSFSEAMIKKVTSQDTIEARRMREDVWSFTPTHTSILCTNHKPVVKGQDVGVWRRLKLVPFLVDLTDKKDITIPNRLRTELAGVANWLLQGNREGRAEGIGSCKAVDDATEEYREAEDEFSRVFMDLFDKKIGAVVTVEDAFSAYASAGHRLGRKKFIKEMKRVGYDHERHSVSGRRMNCFLGITTINYDFGGS